MSWNWGGFLLCVVLWGLLAGCQTDSAVLLTGGDPAAAAALATRTAQDNARLNSYGWVDQEAQVAHIPIERALALLVEEGLPVGPAESPSKIEPLVVVDPNSVSFERDVLPIFVEHCSECHGDELPEEDLVLTSYRDVMFGSIWGSVVTPGEPENSYLVELIETGQMPKRGEELSAEETATIVAWITAGASDN